MSESSELPGLYTAIQVIDDHLQGIDDESDDPKSGLLVAVRDDLYARITRLGGQWPRGTEAGDKQPPTS